MQLQVFKYKDEDVLSDFTAIEIDGEVWFIAPDVCCLLGIVNVSDALATLDDDEKLTSVLPRSGQNRKVNLVNESGLYTLVFKSKKPNAKRFRKWVTSTVLPTIRKTGSFDGIDRSRAANFVTRFNDNFHNIDTGYFSVISELFMVLYGRFETLGYRIPNKAYSGKEIRPDVSVGKCFSAYLRTYHLDKCDKYKMYMHEFPNGTKFEARQYADELLPIFRKYVLTEWIPKNATAYFNERDRKALDYLPKLLVRPAA